MGNCATTGDFSMPKYLCLQRTVGNANPTQAKPSPADMQAMYAAFNSWREQFQANLPDLGGRLGVGRLVTAEPAIDGPVVEIKELVGGYMIVEAANLDEAVRVASGCPGLLGPGSGVEVIEIRTP